MRKYKQLLLLIFSAISLTLFLIYRHQYNQLHYVLEVFNFFGQPCNLTDLINSNRMADRYDWGPPPIFVYDNDIYFYSSFWIAKDKEVKGSIVKHRESTFPKECFLWYEGDDHGRVAQFKYSPRDTGDLLETYYFYCKGNDKRAPYAVTYKFKNGLSKKQSVNIRDGKKIAFNMTVCVVDSDLINKKYLVDFLSFHSLIGIDSFIIYSSGLPHNFTKFIQNFAPKLNFNITFFPFNFPESKLNYNLIESDCVLRAALESKYVITLNFDEYIVPTFEYKLAKALDNVSIRSDKLNLSVQKFCNWEEPNLEPLPLQNYNVLYSDVILIRTIYFNSNKRPIKEDTVDEAIISIHKYTFCKANQRKFSTYKDTSADAYATDLSRSTLIQLLLKKLI